MSTHLYNLWDPVIIELSEVKGTVIARAEHTEMPNSYMIKHLNGIGDVVYTWLNESEISSV